MAEVVVFIDPIHERRKLPGMIAGRGRGRKRGRPGFIAEAQPTTFSALK
jgi:hypothetical protein